ncbi:hypothetical protein [Pseudomonas paeninsulae]|uniref:hypothetical protein n=1 Tax=Pseudomonas paeninsulae TaxID=3110772 RepID=UPI002D7760C2|nr:hypothetical protein [Pseudomonas sp. IT1137]
MTPFVTDVIDKRESIPMLQRLATAPGEKLLRGTSARRGTPSLVCRDNRVSLGGYAVNKVVEEALFR